MKFSIQILLTILFAIPAFAKQCYRLMPVSIYEIAGIKLGTKQIPYHFCTEEIDKNNIKVTFLSDEDDNRKNEIVAVLHGTYRTGMLPGFGGVKQPALYITIGYGKVLNTNVSLKKPLLMKIWSDRPVSTPSLRRTLNLGYSEDELRDERNAHNLWFLKKVF